MAQTGYTPIQLYHSTTAAAAPTAGNLANGELAINITDGKLYYKDNGGNVHLLASQAGAAGDVVGPASATDNALVRFDATTGKLVQNSVGILSDTGDLSGIAALSMSGALTLSGGTANGVAYLNGSKVLTTGSALTFDGTNFATTGSVTSAGASNSGNLNFTGTGNRITGDFSNATQSDRVLFQTNTTNGFTTVGFLPNGTGTGSSSRWYSSSDVANASIAAIISGGSTSSMSLQSTTTGTGTYLPMTFFTGGSERMRLDTNGRLGIGTSASNTNAILTANGNIAVALPTRNAASSNQIGVWTSDDPADNTRAAITFLTTAGASSSNSAITFSTNQYGVSSGERMRIDASGNVGIGTNNPGVYGKLDVVGAGYAATAVRSTDASGVILALAANSSSEARLNVLSNHPLALFTNNAERMRIDSSGNVGIGTSSPAGKLAVSTGDNRKQFVVKTSTDPVVEIGLPDWYNIGSLAFINGSGGERMRIDSSGNVGIGTSSPAGNLDVSSSGATSSIIKAPSANLARLIIAGNGASPASNSFDIIHESGSQAYLFNRANSFMAFGTNNTERMRIDSSGNVGIGTSSPTTLLDIYKSTAVEASVRGDAGTILSANRYSTDVSAPLMALRKFRGSVASPSAVASGDNLGQLVFVGYGGTNNRGLATVRGYVETYTADNNISSYLSFWTSAAGGVTQTERLRIDSSGNLLVNGTATPASGVGTLAIFNGTAPTGSVTNGIVLYAEDVSSSSELKVRDEAGNVTTLSPHNFSLIPEGPSEDMAWAYYSEKNGKRINVDMLKLARMVEKLTGEKLVYED